jgi:hypothetical protein
MFVAFSPNANACEDQQNAMPSSETIEAWSFLLRKKIFFGL